LIRVAGSQDRSDFVTFRLPFQFLLFAALEAAFEIFATIGRRSGDSDDVAVSRAALGFFIDLPSFAERAFLAFFALAAAFRRRRRRGGVLGIGALGVRTIKSHGQFGIIDLTLGGARFAVRRAAVALGRARILAVGRRTRLGRLFGQDETAEAVFAAAL